MKPIYSKKKNRKKLVLTLFYLTLSLVAFASKADTIDIDPNNIPSFSLLDQSISYYISKEGILSYSNIKTRPFQTYYSKDIILQTRSNQVWLKFKLKNASETKASTCYLCTGVFLKLNLYQDQLPQPLIAQAGRILNSSKRSVRRNKYCLQISLAANQTSTFYLEVQKEKKTIARDWTFQIGDKQLIEKNLSQHIYNGFDGYVFDGFFFGVLFFVILFSFFQFRAYRDNAYLFYGFYIVSILLYYLRGFEISYQGSILFSPVMEWSRHIEIVNEYVIIISYTLFFYYFLNIKQTYPKLQSFFNLSLKLFVISFSVNVLLMFFVPVETAFHFYLYVVLLFFISTIYLLVYLLRKLKNNLIYFILGGSAFIIVSALFSVLLDLDFFYDYKVYSPLFRSAVSPIGKIYMFSMRVGVLLEVVCFSLGLSYKSRKMMEENFISQQKVAEAVHLKKQDELKTKFYTNITHEFRTPLTVIQSLADQIIGDGQKLSTKKIKELLHIVKRNGGDLLRLVDQMLYMSKIESGVIQLKTEKIELIHLIENQLAAFKPLADRKQIDFQFQSNVAELFTTIDKEKFQQIISNLLSNAIKFTSKNGSVKLLLNFQKSLRNILTIKVIDTGIGIPKEELPFIFDRFYRVKNAEQNTIQGTGIGLSIVKELLELMDGIIEIESQINEGTQFTIQLPVHVESIVMQTNLTTKLQLANAKTTPALINNNVNTNSSLPLILIVEDNTDLVNILGSFLEKDYRVVFALNGKLGIEKAFKLIPDIIISDVMMPEMDGLQLCDILKNDERTSHIPIILLTALADIPSKLDGLKSGADAYLSKPYNKTELLLRIKNLIEIRKQLQKRYSDPTKLSNSKQSIYKKEDQFILNLRQVIADHLADENLSIEDIARLVSPRLSRSQLYRKYNALTGSSPSALIRNIRLEKAKELLSQQDKSIAEVAYAVGFKDPAYFSRTFSSKFGLSPSAYVNKL